MKKLALRLAFIASILVVLLAANSCYGDPEPQNITIENQTNQALIFDSYGDIHTVKPGNQIVVLFIDFKYHIRLKNTQGVVVFDKTYTYQEIKQMGFKVIIPPLENTTIN